MLLVPVPGGGDDVFELGILGFPAEFADGFFGGGDKFGRVAGTAGFFNGGDFFAGDFFAGLDNLTHGIAIAVAEVVKSLFAGREGQDMGLGQINDVDIIPDAGAVGRGIIGAVNLALGGLAERDFEDVRDEVGFDAMMFAEFLAGAGGVEIAEGDKLEAVDLVIPVQHLLEHELGFAVGVDGTLGQIFGHRDAVGGAVGGAGGTEDELFHFGFDGGVQQLQAVADIIMKIFAGVGH